MSWTFELIRSIFLSVLYMTEREDISSIYCVVEHNIHRHTSILRVLSEYCDNYDTHWYIL